MKSRIKSRVAILMSLCFFVDMLICYPQDGGRKDIHITNDTGKLAENQNEIYHKLLYYTFIPIFVVAIIITCFICMKKCANGGRLRRHPPHVSGIAEALLYGGNEPGNSERTTYRYICKPKPADTSSGSLVSDRLADIISERNVNIHENPADFVRIGWTDGRPEVEVRDEVKGYTLYR